MYHYYKCASGTYHGYSILASSRLQNLAYLGIVSPKSREIEIIRVKFCFTSFFKECFEFVAGPEPLARGSDDEDLVPPRRGAALPLGHLPFPAERQGLR